MLLLNASIQVSQMPSGVGIYCASCAHNDEPEPAEHPFHRRLVRLRRQTHPVAVHLLLQVRLAQGPIQRIHEVPPRRILPWTRHGLHWTISAAGQGGSRYFRCDGFSVSGLLYLAVYRNSELHCLW